MSRTLLLTLAFFSTCLLTNAARFDQALKDLNSQNYDGARKKFAALVRNGSYQSVAYLAALGNTEKPQSIRGHKVSKGPLDAKDDDESAKLDTLIKIAFLGDAIHNKTLGNLYAEVCNDKKNRKKSEAQALFQTLDRDLLIKNIFPVEGVSQVIIDQNPMHQEEPSS